ncbi:25021_t:CDS:2, partial [Gigaspora rosea]
SVSNSSDNESDSGSESGSSSGESSDESESESDVKKSKQTKIKKEEAKPQAKNSSKLCKRDQKDITTSGKSRNKSTILEQSIRRILLDMLEKALPAHWLEKLKSEIENPSNSTPTTQPLIPDQISQEADSNESDNDPLEEWHAPA